MANDLPLPMDNLRFLIRHALANPPYSATAAEIERLVREEASLRDRLNHKTAPEEKAELLKAADDIRRHRGA
ncbi:hypothetical protein F0U59_30160 [Archangium gephyra]|nr:hypothetical protein F0U59_30160 [Archangium gephyra]